MPKFPPVDVDIVVPATLVVAASDSLDPSRADYQCDGVNDEAEINQALNALPATGGEVKLLDGTYNCQVTINLDSNQTLRGCGRNTILTTSTANLIFLSAVGGAGTEKTGIVISDMQIDGGAGSVSDLGIYFEYVDYSIIQNVYSRRHGDGSSMSGVALDHSDFNTILGNICQGNGQFGIYLSYCDDSKISGNTCQDNTGEGILLEESSKNTILANISKSNLCGIFLGSDSGDNTISGNVCESNGIGIHSRSDNNLIVSNICQGNDGAGIVVDAAGFNSVVGNTCRLNGNEGITIIVAYDSLVGNNFCCDNSQSADSTYANILLDDSSYITVIGNSCHDSGITNQPDYALKIIGTSIKNLIQGNDLMWSGGIASLYITDQSTKVMEDNNGIEITQVREYSWVKNTSGGALALGDVVVLKAVAAGNEITTTTTEGDQLVYGMVMESIANGNYGNVQVKGKTPSLKVNGTTDIAIGDLIGTFTTAKIGMKAASGKMAFAIALEAYTNNDSNGVIDALLITPRQAI